VEGVGGAYLEARIFKSKFLEKLHDFFKNPHLKKANIPSPPSKKLHVFKDIFFEEKSPFKRPQL